MRLTCPNCGAEYEVPEGMVPPAGRHVQCTSCHTRWFVRGSAREMLSEDQIIRRLETWSPRPRPVPVPNPVVASAPEPADDPRPFVWETLDERPAPEAASAPDPDPPAPAAPPVPDAPRKPAAPAVPQPQTATGRSTAPRLALTLDPERRDEPPLRGPSRFGRGMLAALALCLLAFATYSFADPIAARLPALAPAVQGFAAAVDGLRERLAERLMGAD